LPRTTLDETLPVVSRMPGAALPGRDLRGRHFDQVTWPLGSLFRVGESALVGHVASCHTGADDAPALAAARQCDRSFDNCRRAKHLHPAMAGDLLVDHQRGPRIVPNVRHPGRAFASDEVDTPVVPDVPQRYDVGPTIRLQTRETANVGFAEEFV